MSLWMSWHSMWLLASDTFIDILHLICVSSTSRCFAPVTKIMIQDLKCEPAVNSLALVYLTFAFDTCSYGARGCVLVCMVRLPCLGWSWCTSCFPSRLLAPYSLPFGAWYVCLCTRDYVCSNTIMKPNASFFISLTIRTCYQAVFMIRQIREVCILVYVLAVVREYTIDLTCGCSHAYSHR
jgi:hypothetical protein